MKKLKKHMYPGIIVSIDHDSVTTLCVDPVSENSFTSRVNLQQHNYIDFPIFIGKHIILTLNTGIRLFRTDNAVKLEDGSNKIPISTHRKLDDEKPVVSFFEDEMEDIEVTHEKFFGENISRVIKTLKS